MPKGNNNKKKYLAPNRWYLLLITALSSSSIGILIGWNICQSKLLDQCHRLNNNNKNADTVSTPLFQQIEKEDELSSRITTTIPSKQRNNLVCDLSTDVVHLEDPDKFDYPDQVKAGPMQADEMLFVFSLVRTTFVTRILELGGYRGDSAYNFLKALRCKGDRGIVYTVDKAKVESQQHHFPVGGPRHVTIMKDAADLTANDFDQMPIDLVLLDCHSYQASKHVLQTLWRLTLLAPNAYIILHDTGLHPHDNYFSTNTLARFFSIVTEQGLIHQPVERLLADWIPYGLDCSFQRISLHDDTRKNTRHGLTIMQRKMVLDFFDECKSVLGKDNTNNDNTRSLHDFTVEDCEEVKTSTLALREKCPNSIAS